MKKQIESVRVETVSDESPDLSYMGEYTNEQSPEAFIRCGKHAGKQVKLLTEEEREEIPPRGRNSEYLYFLPTLTGEQSGNLNSPEQDFRRMEDYGNGWSMVGIVAKAVVVSEQGISQTLRSGGLWGIESDSDADHIAEVSKEQLGELRAELESFGFGKRAIDHAFKSVSNVNR